MQDVFSISGLVYDQRHELLLRPSYLIIQVETSMQRVKFAVRKDINEAFHSNSKLKKGLFARNMGETMR